MATVDSNTTQWFDTQVERGWYSYFVTANYADGTSLNSDTVAVEMPSGQGLVEPSAGLPNVAPNPVQGRVLRLSDADRVVMATITDLMGRQLVSLTNPRQIANGIALPHLASGHYLLQLTLVDGTSLSRKFAIE